MKKSIVYLTLAISSIMQLNATESVMSQNAEIAVTDTLKENKLHNFADNSLVHPETIFPRKTIASIDQVITADTEITESTVQECSNLQFPIITEVELKENNQIIDAAVPELYPLDFSLINIPAKNPQVISKTNTFTAL